MTEQRNKKESKQKKCDGNNGDGGRASVQERHERNGDLDSLVNCCGENEHITNGCVFLDRGSCEASFREHGGEDRGKRCQCRGIKVFQPQPHVREGFRVSPE